MTTNVSVEYSNAEKKFQAATTPEEKLKALYELQRSAPSHKGAEKLRAEISGKIKRIRAKMERQEEQRKKASSRSISVKKEGIGQIVLVGMPNSGKSSVLKALTNADVVIAPYPFTTRLPVVGMMPYLKARIQLVDLPPIVEGSADGKSMGRELFGVIRNADALVLVLDSANIESEFALLKEEFAKVEISFNSKANRLSIEKSKFPGITLINEPFYKDDVKELKSFLRKRGLSNATLILRDKVGLTDVTDCLVSKIESKRSFALVIERKGVKANPSTIALVKKEMDVLTVSDYSEQELEPLRDELFKIIEKVLVYTKKPGDKRAEKPMALILGSTVAGAARLLHQDFETNFRYAKIWGSARYKGQRVSKDYELKTGDIVELYC